jgi:hypothetical protein
MLEARVVRAEGCGLAVRRSILIYAVDIGNELFEASQENKHCSIDIPGRQSYE